MSEQEPTPVDGSPEGPQEGLVLRAIRFLLLALVLSPVVAVHGYLHADGESVDAVESIDDRITYLTGIQPARSGITEVDLGDFNISVVRPEIRTTLRIRFQLAGLVSEQDLHDLEDFRVIHEHRLRDMIITELTKTESKHFSDPRLSELRSSLMNHVNDMSRPIVFRDLIFSRFSMVKQ